MELIFHGGASEVGRSCIELKITKNERYLLDLGIKFKENGLQLPENIENIKDISAVLLTHAHLDHAGGLPLFEHQNLSCPIYTTRQTFVIAKLMLKDSFKVARIRNMHPAYNITDLKKIEKDVKKVSYDKWYKHKNISFKFLNAGHIPGSAMILIKTPTKNILYTGDINTEKTELMFNVTNHNHLKNNIDILISESTNAHRDLPKRQELGEKFVQSIKETIKKGGSVIIPVFSVGRAQEIMILLNKGNFDVPIYSEGLSNKVTRQILANKSKYIDNKEILSKMFYEKIQWISSEKKRKDAIKKQGIFITTSGMIQGGPVLSYIKELWHDEKSKIMTVGYQCKNTNGWHLVKDKYLYIDGWKTYVKCEIEQYPFSGHADSTSLKKFVEFINPKKVIFQHGDPESVEIMKTWAESKKIPAIAPIVGDKISFNH